MRKKIITILLIISLMLNCVWIGWYFFHRSADKSEQTFIKNAKQYIRDKYNIECTIGNIGYSVDPGYWYGTVQFRLPVNTGGIDSSDNHDPHANFSGIAFEIQQWYNGEIADFYPITFDKVSKEISAGKIKPIVPAK